MEDHVLNISLKVNQINVILASLAKMPFESVADIISEIRQQAQAQIDQLVSSAPVEKAE